MDPLKLIPQPDTIPVHWGWFQLLLTITFILHLLFMNTMLGCGMITLIREFGSGKESEDMNREMSLKLPYTVAFTVNMGVAPLLFLQVLYGHFMYTSSILMAVYWLSTVFLIILAYYCIYIYDFKFEALGQARRVFIAVGVILLLWVGFIFSNNMTLMVQPEKWSQYFHNPYGTLLNLGENTLIPRYLHFVVASVAVGGLFQALAEMFKPRTDGAEKVIRSGLNWFSGATAVQFLVGLWFLFSLPKDKMLLFLGEGRLPTFFLAAGITGGIAALYFAARNKVWSAAGAALMTIIMMVLVRDLLRSAYLKPYFSLDSLKIVPEYSPMILFLVSFAAGIMVIIYMLKLASTAGKEG